MNSRSFIGSAVILVGDRLDCDIVVIKPREFRTRIPRRVITALTAIFALATASCVTMSDYSVRPTEYPGVRLYQVFCSSCHGLTGHGDGPVGPLIRGGIPDLTRISERHGGQFPREQVQQSVDGREVLLAHGTARMPVWGFEFYDGAGTQRDARQRADTTIKKLVDYLESIQRTHSE